jgi:hypothetical protein
MKTDNKQILIITTIIIGLCFLAVFIFTMPSLVNQFNLSTDSKSNIGSAIGGITAPLIGIFSSVLLYLALTKQTQSNIDQRIKNESDIIFLLLNQLDNEISNLYFHFTENTGAAKTEFNYSGVQAFHIFVQQLNTKKLLTNFGYTFNSFYQAKQVLLVIRSFVLVENRIELSEISRDLKAMFYQKLDLVYQCKLSESLKILLKVIEEYPNVKDHVTEEIEIFVKAHSADTTANSGFASAGGDQ